MPAASPLKSNTLAGNVLPHFLSMKIRKPRGSERYGIKRGASPLRLFDIFFFFTVEQMRDQMMPYNPGPTIEKSRGPPFSFSFFFFSFFFFLFFGGVFRVFWVRKKKDRRPAGQRKIWNLKSKNKDALISITRMKVKINTLISMTPVVLYCFPLSLFIPFFFFFFHSKLPRTFIFKERSLNGAYYNKIVHCPISEGAIWGRGNLSFFLSFSFLLVKIKKKESGDFARWLNLLAPLLHPQWCFHTRGRLHLRYSIRTARH